MVDTTGAGDAFTGAFAFFTAAGLSLKEATRRAGAVATGGANSGGARGAAARPPLPSRFHSVPPHRSL